MAPLIAVVPCWDQQGRYEALRSWRQVTVGEHIRIASVDSEVDSPRVPAQGQLQVLPWQQPVKLGFLQTQYMTLCVHRECCLEVACVRHWPYPVVERRFRYRR